MTDATGSTPLAELTQLLTQSPAFRGLRTVQLQAVLEAAHRRWVAQNTFFFHQGDPAVAFYILIQGAAKLIQVTPEGHQMLVRFVAPGEEFGGITALREASYTLSAQAVEDCLALAWKGETLARLMERYPRIAFNMLELVAGYYRWLLDRYQSLITKRVEQRVARCLLRLARQTGQTIEGGVLIGLPLSREDLAEMTGTTLYTVSRILSGWEQQGFVEAGRERVLIRQAHILVAIAEDLPPSTPVQDL
jgi:CRP-like cAMP-binding protein